MSNDYYPYEVVNGPQQHDSHVALYDTSILVAYRIAAKKGKHVGLTMALKSDVNLGCGIGYLSFSDIRRNLLAKFPNYLKELSNV